MPDDDRSCLERRHHCRTILAFLLAVGVLAIPSVLWAQQPRSEVLVIGSIHAPRAFFWEPGYTPAHVRASRR